MSVQAFRSPRLGRAPVRSGDRGRTVGMTLVFWLFVTMYAIPVVWFLLSSFKPAGELFSYPLTIFPKNPTIKGYTQAWTSFSFPRYFLNTLFVTGGPTILTVAASALSGYALAKYQSWWLKAFSLCILATTMLPTEVILAPSFLVVRNLGLYNHLMGVVVPSILTATGTFMFRQFFVTVPNDLLEAARIDGSSEWSTLLRIMIPLARP